MDEGQSILDRGRLWAEERRFGLVDLPI